MRFLFVDRITALVPGTYTRGLKHITVDDVFLIPNSQGHHHFASSLIGETLGQLAAWNVMHSNGFTRRPVAGVVAKASLHRQAYVGDTLELESFIDHLDDQAVRYHSVAKINNEIVFTIEDALGPLLPMEQFINTDVVRSQFDEIYRLSTDLLPLVETHEQIRKPAVTIPLQFDRILAHEPGQSMTAEKRISRSAPYFADHFPSFPVLPMTVLLECKLHLAQLFLTPLWAEQYQVKELRKIKMNEFVLPGDVLICYLTLHLQDEHQLILRYRSEANGKRVCVVDMVFHKKVGNE